MKPEDKAQGLIDRFMQFTPADEEFEYAHAKSCATIYVEGLINEWENIGKPENTTYIIQWGTEPIIMDGYERLQYWEEVRNKINES